MNTDIHEMNNNIREIDNGIFEVSNNADDIFVIGDLHGDYQVLIHTLVDLCECCSITRIYDDIENNYSCREYLSWLPGVKRVVIFCGDLIHRKRFNDHVLDDECSDIYIIETILRLKKEAFEQGALIDKVLGYKNVRVKTFKLEGSYGNLIELLYFYNSPKTSKHKIYPYSVGYTHLSLTVTNIKKIFKTLLKNKIKFNSDPKISNDGKVIMTYCVTPENGFLELVEEI